MTAALDDFINAMNRAGIGAPRRVIGDGRLNRFQGEGDKPGRLNSWYVLHLDGRPAGAFGSWRTGQSETWVAGGDDRLTPAERAELRRRIHEAKAKAEAERREAQRGTAATVWAFWNEARPADPAHPYLRRKAVGPHGLRQRGGLLLVPLADAAGRLWNVQTIGPDGTKLFRRHGRVAGMFATIGDPATASTLVICEGWATAATIHEATGLPTLAAMNASSLEPVAKMTRRQWPGSTLVIAADNDHGTAGNPGLSKARAAAVATGALVVQPPTMPGVTDFNDLGRAETHLTFTKSGVLGVPGVPGRETPQKSAVFSPEEQEHRAENRCSAVFLGAGR
ncbi:MAG: toprim domain-containing protein [Geminicoccaceae bacterium]|nr:MAG: toprim domain-containing protein [Geminicoccaceae bacterium]